MVDSRPQWLAALRKLAASAVPEDVRDNPPVVPSFGTVRSLDPLRIALDSDPATTLPYAPACLEVPTAVGQRVWVQTYGRQVVVVGVVKTAAPAPVAAGEWKALTTFGSGWSVYSGDTPRYIVLGGVVYLTGRLTKATAPALGENVLTLPAEARPPARILLAAPTANSSNVISFGAVDVRNTGSVEYRGGSNAWVSFAGLAFPKVALPAG